MVQTLQQDQVDKMYFEIVFDLSLHHVGEFEACQTGSNIFTFFLSPLWRLGPRINILRDFKRAKAIGQTHVDKSVDQSNSSS